MPSPYDYNVAQPQVSTYFDAMRQGRADRLATEQDTRNSALSKYLPGALQGDDAQRKSALDAVAGDPNMVMQLSQTFAGADQQKLAKAREVNGQLASLAMWANTPDKWPIALAEARKISPDIGDIPFEQRGAIIAKFQTVSEQLEAAYKQQMLANDTSRTTAQNAASYAQAEAARANADYIRGGKMGGGVGGKFGPGGKPLTERESKDLSWAVRGDEANKGFTPERISHLINARNVIGRNVPIVGNKLQTDQSRQAVQTAKNFVAVVLRKDTGAAVTEKEFDFYEDIFIPAWGDDDGTLQMKAQARSQFLYALKMGLGPRSALAKLGVTPPEGVAPPEDDKTSVIEAQGGWSATVEE